MLKGCYRRLIAVLGRPVPLCRWGRAVAVCAVLLMAVPMVTMAQRSTNSRPLDGLEYSVEWQSSFSHGNTPLWLNSNKYGLSSLDEYNGYLRGAVERPLSVDDGRKWGIGYGVDVAIPYNYTSDIVLQQAYVEGRWWHGTLSIGSKEYPMELKNNELSSGSQTLGKNARPVPQIRIALPDYWAIPILNRWIKIKGHIAYGKFTDSNWKEDFTQGQSTYAEDVLYHSKAGYIKIGKEEDYYHFSVEMGLEMACQFGGTTYVPNGDGTYTVYKNGTGWKAYWNAFKTGGSDVSDSGYENVEGNQLGSWLLRLNWTEDTWKASVYIDKYFEDHSGMFLLDYDGYGEGDEWDVHKDNDYFLYDFKDMMIGAEVNIIYGTWLRDIVFEYIYTKYQSGPVYHDHTQNVSDHIGGNDNYYNHGLYSSWSHWGMVMGNPLYRSPIYNSDGSLSVQNNRYMAFHLGVDGQPTEEIGYRFMATWQEGLGTYDDPYKDKEHNLSFLLEATYTPTCKKLRGWSAKGSLGMDFGEILGDNYGFQLTIKKEGFLNFKSRKRLVEERGY